MSGPMSAPLVVNEPAVTSLAVGGVIGGTTAATVYNSGDFGALPIKTTGYVGVGVAPIAATGDIRLSNLFNIYYRNAANTADQKFVTFPAANVIQIGSNGADGPASVYLYAMNSAVLGAQTSALIAASSIFLGRHPAASYSITYSLNEIGASTCTVASGVTSYVDSQAIKTVAGAAASRSTSAQSAAVGLGGDGGDYTISAGAKDGAGRVGRVNIPGAQLRGFRNVGAVDYVIDAAGPDWTIFQDASAAARTITLPTAATHPGRVLHYVVDLGMVGSTGTILPTGADTIDGAASVVLNGAGRQRATFQSSGVADWVRIA